MRVLIASPNPGSDAGGVERFCHTLAASMIALGHFAEVVSWRQARRARAADVVVTNGTTGGRVSGRIPRVHVFHGCWFEHVRASYPLSPWAVRFAVQGVAAEVRAGAGATRVAVSRATADEVLRWYRQRSDIVIHNAVDTNVFMPGNRLDARLTLGIGADARVALFVGRVEGRKRPDLASAAAAAAGYELAHAGSGVLKGAQHSFGVLDRPTLVAVLQSADCLIAPSEYEACSFVILEALACGIPVVATRVGWVRELVDAIPAYASMTSERGDVAALKRSLDTLDDHAAAVFEAHTLVRRDNSIGATAVTWDKLLTSVVERHHV